MKKFSLFIALIFMVSCSALNVAEYDNYAYEQTENLKSFTLQVMGNATTPYQYNVEYVELTENELQDHYAYEQAREHNEQTVAMWEIMLDPNGNMISGFFNMWRENETLSAAFVTEAKSNVEQGFNEILELEKAKR